MKAAAVLVVLLLAGCGGQTAASPPASTPTPTPVAASPTPKPTPDLAKCRAAIRADYEAGWSGGDKWPPSTRKPVCSGIDRPTLQRLMDEAIDDIMGGTTGPG
jgi:hypothetical protein